MAFAFSLVLASVASAQIPAGGEFAIGAYATSSQWNPRVSMEPDGDFVVVWSSGIQDGDQNGVFGQRFAASGAPRGGAFQINTYTTGNQGEPDVAVGERGDFVVAWARATGGYGDSIHARRYDASGAPMGDEFQVSASTPATGYYDYGPHVGRASDGRFIVSWGGRDPVSMAFVARRYDAAGSPIGSEFVVNPTTAGHQHSGDLAVDADGSFVAVWEDYDSTDIFGQRYDASGNRLGSEFLVNNYSPGGQGLPSINMSPAGGFVVAWNDAGADGSARGVFSRRFDGAGNALGNDFLVNTYTTGHQAAPDVTHDARGNFVVAWTSAGQDGSAYGSFAQRFSASGTPRGAEFRVNSATLGPQMLPSVASDAVGNLVVAWHGLSQIGTFAVSARRFGGLGPAALTVDSQGNRVLEPGETVDVRPAWGNLNGAPQTFAGTLASMMGPVGATYAIADGIGGYGTVANGFTAQCTDCYSVFVSNPPVRPAVHWDASAVEAILPDAHGQQMRWLLHVGASFTDVAATSPFYRFVETILHENVTGGCTSTAYCPGASTSREQMAVFVLVAREPAGYSPAACGPTPMFADVPASSPFCAWIEELARRNVVTGCSAANYCPSASATREQMAVFVLRTLDPSLNPPACATPMFADVPASNPFCRWIEELTRRNVVTGCGGGNYCPATDVTREQMSVFLTVTFGLTLYGL